MAKKSKNNRVKKATQKRRHVAKLQHPTAKARYNQIKGYVDFEFEDTDYCAAKIRNYYNELWDLIKQPNTVYKTRSEKNMRIATKAAGIKSLKQLKAIPIPSGGTDDLKVKIKGSELIVESDFVTQEFLPFDKISLAKNPKAHIDKLLKGRPKAERYKIKTGAFEMNATLERGQVAPRVMFLQQKYTPGAEYKGKPLPENRHWNRWLNGIVAIHTHNQISAEKYNARQLERKKQKYRDSRRDHVGKNRGKKNRRR